MERLIDSCAPARDRPLAELARGDHAAPSASSPRGCRRGTTRPWSCCAAIQTIESNERG